MAQEIQQFNRRLNGHAFQSKSLAVAVAVAGLTTLLEFQDVTDLIRIAAQFDVATNPFDAFEVQAKFHKDGAYVALYNTSGAFTSPVGLIVGASGNLTAQGAGTTGWLIMETRGIQSIRFQASAGVGIATVNAFACGG